jgi:hypothetical protein
MFNSFHVSPELQSILDQELEAEIKPRFPTGIELTMNGKCPKGATSAAPVCSAIRDTYWSVTSE